jgi:WD40 repeat protein
MLIWCPETGTLTQSWPDLEAGVTALRVYHPSTSGVRLGAAVFLVCGYHTGAVRVYDSESGALIQQLHDASSRVTVLETVCGQPDGDWIIAGTESGCLMMWAADTGALLWRRDDAGTAQVNWMTKLECEDGVPRLLTCCDDTLAKVRVCFSYPS